MSQRRWKIKQVDKELVAQLSQTCEINPFLALILASRGYENEEAVASFATEGTQLIDPFQIGGMEVAANRIRLALDQGETIAVYGDFDADGVTATALLCSFLESEGGHVLSYIPNRESEGYGLNVAAITSLHAQGVQLLITVDNGIAAIEEANAVAALGMDLIVTDHHKPGEILPTAVAVVDPHCNPELPFHDWSGVGVAFKVACAIYEGEAEVLLTSFSDLVAIGTVADIVPLKGENRLLVKHGLEVLNNRERLGIQAFCQVTNNQQRQFTSMDLGFLLGPRINAAGRMHTADCALELLLADDYDRAMLCAAQLCEYNTQRQETEQTIIKDISSQIEAHPHWLADRVLVLDGADYHNGVIGIVASRMVQTYGKPCVILNRQVDGVARGSCRSVEGFSIYEALRACQDDLLRFGGHPMAAGLSLQNDRIDIFRKHINAYAKEHFAVIPQQAVTIDCRIAPAYLTLDLLEELALLEPYGAENEQPVFGLFHLQLSAVKAVGNGKHLRLTFAKGNATYCMMYFGQTQALLPFAIGDTVDAAVKISKNLWEGRELLSIQICDMKPSRLNQEWYFEEKALYDSFCLGEELEQNSLKTLLPSREESGAVYRCLCKQKQRPLPMDAIYFSVFEQGISYGKLSVMLDAFEETGLIQRVDGMVTLLPSQGKVDLESAKILMSIRSRVEHG